MLKNLSSLKIRLLSVLCLASIATTITGCKDVNQFFTYEKNLVEDILSVVPAVSEVINPEEAWSEILSSNIPYGQTNYVPVVLYDELMNPDVLQTKVSAPCWEAIVTVLGARRIFNAQPLSADDIENNFASLNAELTTSCLEDESEEHPFKAILCAVNKEDFAALCAHYSRYSLVPVMVSKPVDDQEAYSLGFMFSITDASLLSSSTATPSPESLLNIINSLEKSFGIDFQTDFVTSTLLASEDNILKLLTPTPYRGDAE